MIGKIFAIVEKNIRRLLRSKISASIIILGPLILIAVVGIAFNNIGLFGININVYSDNYDETVETLLGKLETKHFVVTKIDDNETCIENVKNGVAHVCIQFQTTNLSKTRIQFYLDFSRINLVFTLLESLSGRFSDESKKISLGLTQELIDKLRDTSTELKNKSLIIDDMKKSAEDLGVELVVINQQISALDVGVDLSQFDVTSVRAQTKENKKLLTDYEASLDSGLSENREKLETFEVLALEMRVELDYQMENRDEILGNIQDVYDVLACNSGNSVNLQPYLDSPDLVNIISSLDSPTCSFLLTYRILLEDSTSELDEISDQLDSLIVDIAEAKQNLDDFEAESDGLISKSKNQLELVDDTLADVEGGLVEAENKMSEIDSAKRNLSSQLLLMEHSLSSNLDKFDLMKSSLSELNQKLEQISVISPESIVNPIQTEIKSLEMNKTTLDYLFPSLIVLVVMFVSILIAGTLIMKEKSSSAYFRNFITPTSNFVFILGTYLTTLIISFMQVFLVILIAIIFFDLSIGNFLLLMSLILLIITIFSLIGMIIGNVFQSEETTTLTSIIVSVILFIFSSTIIPIEQMSRSVASLAKINPFVVSEILLRKIIIFGSGISLDVNLLILFVHLLILALLTILSFKIAQREEEEG